jgi:hypothetical protein
VLVAAAALFAAGVDYERVHTPAQWVLGASAMAALFMPRRFRRRPVARDDGPYCTVLGRDRCADLPRVRLDEGARTRALRRVGYDPEPEA